jgi:hypothetical protein
MLHGNKVIVVMPAFHAGRTLAATWRELPHDIVDEVIVVDDSSHDDYGERRPLARPRRHPAPAQRRLRRQPEDVLHAKRSRAAPTSSSWCIPTTSTTRAWSRDGRHDRVGRVRPRPRVADPRRRSRSAGGMPLWKYAANRALTTFENTLVRAHLSEYHTGYRAYSRSFLDRLPWQFNSDDYVFDNEILAQAIVGGFRIGEVSVPTRYFADASSITFARSVRYGVGVVRTTLRASVARIARLRDPMFVRRDALVPAPRSGHDGLARQREELVAAPGGTAEQAERHAVDGRPERRGSVAPT